MNGTFSATKTRNIPQVLEPIGQQPLGFGKQLAETRPFTLSMT